MNPRPMIAKINSALTRLRKKCHTTQYGWKSLAHCMAYMKLLERKEVERKKIEWVKA